MNKKYLVLSTIILTLMISAMPLWGAIGVYKWSASASVPSTITYMLNMDADDVSDTWSVKIEIQRESDNSVVKTFSYLYPDTHCTRGLHSDIIWDGTKDDGTTASQGAYKAVITAKAAAVTGTDLKGIYTNAPNTYYAVAVNNNVNSQWYGYIYLSVYHKGIAIVPPDCSSYTLYNFGMTWDSSSPWGIAVDDSDNVWLASRSGTNGKKAYIFKPDLSGLAGYGPLTYADNDRYFDVLGPTDNIYAADIANYTAGGAAYSYSRINTFHGDVTALSSATSMLDWKSDVGSDNSWATHGGALYDEGSTDGPVLYVGARLGVTSSAWNSGAVCKYAIDWTTGTATLAWANAVLTYPMCVDISPDGTTLGITRQTTTAGTQFWTVPLADAETATSATAYGFTPPPDYNQSGSSSYSYTKNLNLFRYDSLGNVVAVFSGSNCETQQGYWGLFAVPDNGSTNTRTTGTISWTYPQPVITSTNSPVSVSSCQSGATTTATVNVTCAEGINKVSSVTIDLTPVNPALGLQVMSGGGTGNTGSWSKTFGVTSGLRTGSYNCTVSVNSVHSELPATTGTVVVNVTGGTIYGAVTNSKSDWAISGATVTASDGINADYTTTTDSNGNYTLAVNPGTYNLAVTDSAYDGQVETVTGLVVTCSQSIQKNIQMDPLDVYTATEGNSYDTVGRTPGSNICVVGTVLRASVLSTGTYGLSGYYYLYDNLHENTVYSIRVNDWTGTPSQPAMKEGDIVVVEGNWDAPSGIKQGRITPSRVPVVIGTGTLPEKPDELYTSLLSQPYGRYFHAYGEVTSVVEAGGAYNYATHGPYFLMESPVSETDPTIKTVVVRLNTPTTIGISSTAGTLPVVGQMIHVNGILGYLDLWGEEAGELIPGKPADVYLVGDAVPNISDAKKLNDGDNVGLLSGRLTGLGGGFPDGVFYLESADRSNAIRVHADSSLMPTGTEAVGIGDAVAVHGVMATTDIGERYIEADIVTRGVGDGGACLKPLDALGMNCRAAGEERSLGMFVKLWGKVTNVEGTTFTLTDGSTNAVKVYCGSIIKPVVNDMIRVRGVVSKESNGTVLYMRNEQADWTSASATYQPLPLPGAYRYPREWLICGPFADANSTDQTYRIDHDFIQDATSNVYSESTIRPKEGDVCGTNVWTRTTTRADLDGVLKFTDGGTTSTEYCTYYAFLWLWSPIDLTYGVKVWVGSDDGIRVIMEDGPYGMEPTGRSIAYGQDGLDYMSLHVGLNPILIKVDNIIEACQFNCIFVDEYYPYSGAYGETTGLPNLGYVLSMD